MNDAYIIKILLVASKKAITRHWCKETQKTPATKKNNQWLTIVEEIVMEELTHKLRLQEAQFNGKWEKWTLYRTQNEDIGMEQ